MRINLTNKDSPTLGLNEVENYIKSLGASRIVYTEIFTICSEIIHNIIKHTPKGYIELKKEDNYILIEAKDEGSGIENISNALKEGYSTVGSLGIGVSAIIRLCDEMNIETSKEGTYIKCKKVLR